MIDLHEPDPCAARRARKRAEDLHRPDCRPDTCTLTGVLDFEPADVARRRGWGVGTVIEGDEGYGPTRIRITAVGKTSILAVVVDGDTANSRGLEGLWTLSCRCWGKVDREKRDGA